MPISTPIEKTRIKHSIEKFSSAFTMSDMEIFVFPELMYSLVLANIMSPIIWEWRKDPWFKGIEKKSYTQRINRVKQYIMDNFVFNLDLDTWGITTQETELARFNDFLSAETITRSNALFGYEGDKYYFSIDIRKHFGLDKYTSNIIPYWKTETVEAMKAFIHKKDYNTGAGECVSLSTLYAAALFIVARIPLQKIFLMATPLHSQNFIALKDGILTNNRRIVTKNMWTNGTSLSSKARRALENEDVTIVSHITGHIHTVYQEATIDPAVYNEFKKSLNHFLKADLKPEIISNFIRKENQYQCCFQYCHEVRGKKMYIEVEKIYKYEHTSPNSFSTDSRSSLLNEIDLEEFSFTPLSDRIMLNSFEDFIRNHPDMSIGDLDAKAFEELDIEKCLRIENMFESLKEFMFIKPHLPADGKKFVASKKLSISVDFSRDEIIEYIRKEAKDNEIAHLTLYAYREMHKIDWIPFIKAAIERNPVCIEAMKGREIEEVIHLLHSMDTESIYNEQRLALPDEVWNFQRGDGLEKAILLANVLHKMYPGDEIRLRAEGNKARISFKEKEYVFESSKGLFKEVTFRNNTYV